MEFNSTNEAPDFDRPKIEEGLYTGTLEEVQEFEGDYGKSLRLIYAIEGKDVKLTHLAGIPKGAVNPENKLGRIFIAHGVDLGNGKVTVEQIIGTRAKVMVEDVSKKDRDGNPTIFSGISKVKKIE